jgi:peroxiredoxin
MDLRRFSLLFLFAAVPAVAGESPVSQAVDRFEARAEKLPGKLAMDFRLRAAQMLKEPYPDLSRRILDEALVQLRELGNRVPATGAAPRLLQELASGQAFTIERSAAAPEPPDPGIAKRIGTMRSLPTDADRAKLVVELVPQIRALPASGAKVNLIRGLAGVATEGDLGGPALTAVAGALADALRELRVEGAYTDGYLEAASLIRYEQVAIPQSDEAIRAASALLEIQEALQQEAGFSLTALDGKTYTLASLKGRIVLLNFWATWCPPCRKEMPDMEKLYRKYEKQGLTVLAVSDEKRETVEGFLAKNPYGFPILLDPSRKVHKAYGVEGIPKSFIFDREGRLAARAMDMRTEAQFLALLSRGGLNP